MKRLANFCPELDGGYIYKQADVEWSSEKKICTLGLSHALVELHLDGLICLHCFQDSRGWSLEEAEPPQDGHTLQSNRIDFIERRNI